MGGGVCGGGGREVFGVLGVVLHILSKYYAYIALKKENADSPEPPPLDPDVLLSRASAGIHAPTAVPYSPLKGI